MSFLTTFFVFFLCVFLFLREEFSYQVDSIYIKQKDNPPPLGGGRSFSLVPGSSPVPAGSRSDLLYNEQIAKQFASLTETLV